MIGHLLYLYARIFVWNNNTKNRFLSSFSEGDGSEILIMRAVFSRLKMYDRQTNVKKEEESSRNARLNFIRFDLILFYCREFGIRTYEFSCVCVWSLSEAKFGDLPAAGVVVDCKYRIGIGRTICFPGWCCSFLVEGDSSWSMVNTDFCPFFHRLFNLFEFATFVLSTSTLLNNLSTLKLIFISFLMTVIGRVVPSIACSFDSPPKLHNSFDTSHDLCVRLILSHSEFSFGIPSTVRQMRRAASGSVSTSASSQLFVLMAEQLRIEINWFIISQQSHNTAPTEHWLISKCFWEITICQEQISCCEFELISSLFRCELCHNHWSSQ